MDRDIAPQILKNRGRRRVLAVVIAIAAIAFFFAATVEWLRPSIRRNDLQTARVERGTVFATVEASGTVVPAFETVISSPIEARVLRINRRSGDLLHAGDEILTLDTSATRLDAGRLSDAVAQKESELEKRSHLFTPFFTTKREGRGLGLTVIQEILTNHGASFWLENRESGGAEFGVRFLR